MSNNSNPITGLLTFVFSALCFAAFLSMTSPRYTPMDSQMPLWPLELEMPPWPPELEAIIKDYSAQKKERVAATTAGDPKAWDFANAKVLKLEDEIYHWVVEDGKWVRRP